MLHKTLGLYKTSFSGLSREVWLLSLIMLVNRSGTMVLPFLTLYLTGPDMKRSLGDAGLVMALFGLGSVAGAFFGGKLTDKSGFYKVQLFSLFFGGILFMVLGQIASYPLICAFTFLLSLVNEAFRPANSSAIAFYSHSKNRTRSYSLNRLSINLGWAVGASLGGFVAAFDYELLFWIDGLTNVFAAVLFYVLFRNTGVKTKTMSLEEVSEKPRSAYRDNYYLVFLVLVSLFAMGFFQLFTTVPNYLRDELQLNEPFIGGIMAINGLIIVFVEMVLIYHLEKKNKNLEFIIFGLILCASAFPVVLLPGPAKLMAIGMIILMTLGEIITMPFMNTYWTLRSNESNRGQYAALYTMAWGISQVVGPYVSAKVVENFNFQVLYLGMALVFLLCALGFRFLKNESVLS
ncbi:MAG: MFS transporter [Bacteroidia bacterium]|jgi:predicted MFS family arabinose efflux permease|nr:MFS transporter [Bacteroidia bacterium]